MMCEKEFKINLEEKLDWFYRQSGVIPFRLTSDGIEVLLITSRRRKHWVIPKGIVEPHLTSVASACQEAWEEAGAHGEVWPQAVGSYTYKKWGGRCRVEVFLLRVEELDEQWPESPMRLRQWFSLEDAVRLVREKGLARLLRGCPKHF